MESITDFLNPNYAPETTGDDVDIEKMAKDDLNDETDTVVVNVDDKSKSPSVKDVVLPGKNDASADASTGSKDNDNSDGSKVSSNSAGDTDSAVDKLKAKVISKEKDKEEPKEEPNADEEDKATSEPAKEEPKEEKPVEKTEDSGEVKEESVENSEEDIDPDAGLDDADDAKSESGEEIPDENSDAPVEVNGTSDLNPETIDPNPPLLKLLNQWETNETKEYELPNGIKLIYAHKSGELCTCMFHFKVGAFDEDDSNRGISHLMEHVMFNGCPGMSSLEFSDKMDRFGVSLNAYTDRECTVFHFNGLKSGFSSAFELYFRLLNSFTLTPEILEKEKGVVLNEIGVYEDDNWSVLSEAEHSNVYRQHPVAYPILGFENTVVSLTVDQVQSWYNDHYVDKNLTVYLVGDFPEEDLVFAANKLLTFREGAVNSGVVITDAMTIPMVKNVIAYKEGITQTLIQSAISYKNEAYNLYNGLVVPKILGGSMSSYLWKEFREERSIAYIIGAYSSNLDSMHQRVVLYSGLNNSEDAELAKDLFQSAFNYAKNITEDEFQKGIAMLNKSVFSSFETCNDIASMLIAIRYLHTDVDTYVNAIKSITHDSYLNFAQNIDIESIVTSILYPMKNN